MHVCHNTIVYQCYPPQVGDTHHKAVILQYGSGLFYKFYPDYKFSGVSKQNMISKCMPLSRFQGSIFAGKVHIIQTTKTHSERGVLMGQYSSPYVNLFCVFPFACMDFHENFVGCLLIIIFLVCHRIQENILIE